MYPSHVVAYRFIASGDSIRVGARCREWEPRFLRNEGRRAGRAEMGTSFINDPEHWRNRAAEARTLADQMNDEPSK